MNPRVRLTTAEWRVGGEKLEPASTPTGSRSPPTRPPLRWTLFTSSRAPGDVEDDRTVVGVVVAASADGLVDVVVGAVARVSIVMNVPNDGQILWRVLTLRSGRIADTETAASCRRFDVHRRVDQPAAASSILAAVEAH